MTSPKYLSEAETQYYRNCKWKRDISILNRRSVYIIDYKEIADKTDPHKL
jgi:hypothetical protein